MIPRARSSVQQGASAFLSDLVAACSTRCPLGNMKTIDYVRILRRSWPILLAAVIVGAALGLAAAKATPEKYTSSARLFVSAQAGTTASDLLQGSNFAQERVKSYAAIATSRSVLVPVAERLRVPGGASRLASQTTATNPVDTVLIRVEVTDRNPQNAARYANAVSQQLKTVVGTLEPPQSSGGSTVRVSIVEGAQPANEPSSPNTKLYVAFGLLAGLLLTWLLVLSREIVDTRLRSKEELAELSGLPILAELPHQKGRGGLVPDAGHPTRAHAEAYRQLRTNLQFADVDNPPRCIVVTSSVPVEGKSTVATNMSATLAESGARVVLVDADLRRPTVNRYMDIPAGAGLTSTLTAQIGLADATVPWGDTTLSVLAAGGNPPNPSELLSSHAMEQVIAELREEFDFVIIDAPPLLPVTDAAILGAKADGVIFVARRGTVRRPQIVRALEILSGVGANVLGVVVNDIQVRRQDAGNYYGAYAYQSVPESSV